MRAALYARFSTELQRRESIEDQLRACRAWCSRSGLEVVAEYEDAAISGASMSKRPGLKALVVAAQARRFDVVVTEALDRLSRSQGDVATLFEDLRYMGVGIRTLAEGEVEEMAVGLKGTMNALLLREIGRKTRRGMVGVAQAGRHAGGRTYGYRAKREIDDKGEYVAGLREIDPAEAEVVRHIFTRYAAGFSPRSIAADLNAHGLAAPRGGAWNASTINGNAARGNGVLHNELYRGRIVWGRQRWTKSRETGARRATVADPLERVIGEAPHLRIVSEELWAKVQARCEATALGPQTRATDARRPKRLLSGLVRCGCCGGPMTVGGTQGRLVCAVRRERGPSACPEGRSVKSALVESRVVTAIQGLLLDPAVVEAAVREHQALSAERRRKAQGERQAWDKELGEVKRRAVRLVDQVADGELSGVAVKDRLAQLERRRAELEALLQEGSDKPAVVALHPAAPARYRRLVVRLLKVLDQPETLEIAAARDAFRAMIRSVAVTARRDGGHDVTVETELAPLVSAGPVGLIKSLGAGTGFEPVTFRL